MNTIYHHPYHYTHFLFTFISTPSICLFLFLSFFVLHFLTDAFTTLYHPLLLLRNSHSPLYSTNSPTDNYSTPLHKPGTYISKEVYSERQQKYHTTLIPHSTLPGIARIYTTQSQQQQCIRYVLSIDSTHTVYVLINIPPYSTQLVSSIQKFIGNTTIYAMLITSKYGIPSSDTNDLSQWRQAFSNVQMIMYRLDIRRNHRPYITQILDGVGPWSSNVSCTFLESGYPLVREEWDSQTIDLVFEQGHPPPDDTNTPNTIDQKQMITKNEHNKHILAIHTPSQSYGSLCYIFPKRNICCSGHLFPIEYSRPYANLQGLDYPGPKLDVSGWITTMDCDVERCMSSARFIVHKYGEKFGLVLGCGGEIGSEEMINMKDDEGVKKVEIIEKWKRVLGYFLKRVEKLGLKYEELVFLNLNSACSN